MPSRSKFTRQTAVTVAVNSSTINGHPATNGAPAPSSYMRVGAQLPPYPGTGRTSPNKVVTYEVWRSRQRSASPGKAAVETQVSHAMAGEGEGGTRTVTRTVTPTGELTVYASQSSVRFKATSYNKPEERQTTTLPRQTYDRPRPMAGRRWDYKSYGIILKGPEPLNSMTLGHKKKVHQTCEL